MIICLCYNINETTLREVAEQLNYDEEQIIDSLGITTGCGICEPHFKEFMRVITP